MVVCVKQTESDIYSEIEIRKQFSSVFWLRFDIYNHHRPEVVNVTICQMYFLLKTDEWTYQPGEFLIVDQTVIVFCCRGLSMNATQQLKKKKILLFLFSVILCQHLCQMYQQSDSQLSYGNYMLFSMFKMSPDGLVRTEKAAKRFSDLENKSGWRGRMAFFQSGNYNKQWQVKQSFNCALDRWVVMKIIIVSCFEAITHCNRLLLQSIRSVLILIAP